MKNKLPYKTFNLFWSYDVEIPFSEKIYSWVTSVGKYIVIGVEMVVLAAFVGRFFLDQRLNDLTEHINDNNIALISSKTKEAYYKRLSNKITIAKDVDAKHQAKLLEQISTVYNIASTYNMTISSISYSDKTSASLLNEFINIIAVGSTQNGKKFEDALQKQILNTSGSDKNDNIRLTELNVSSQQEDPNKYNFTLKITRLL